MRDLDMPQSTIPESIAAPKATDEQTGSMIDLFAKAGKQYVKDEQKRILDEAGRNWKLNNYNKPIPEPTTPRYMDGVMDEYRGNTLDSIESLKDTWDKANMKNKKNEMK